MPSFMSLPLELRLAVYEECGIKHGLGGPVMRPNTWETTEYWRRDRECLPGVRKLRRISVSIRNEVDEEIRRTNWWRFRYRIVVDAPWHPSPVSFFGKIEINLYSLRRETFVQQLVNLIQNLRGLTYTETLKVVIETEAGWDPSGYLLFPRTKASQTKTRKDLDDCLQAYATTIPLKHVIVRYIHRGKPTAMYRWTEKNFKSSVIDVVKNVITSGGADFTYSSDVVDSH
jgi:hypothetical protein